MTQIRAGKYLLISQISASAVLQVLLFLTTYPFSS